MNSCLTFAVMHEGDSIPTIEGLGVHTAPTRHGYDAGFDDAGANQITMPSRLLRPLLHLITGATQPVLLIYWGFPYSPG